MDLIHDHSKRTLLRIQDAGIPDWVKDADVLTSEKEAEGIEPSFFADEDRRRFPVCSPQDTWMSAAYFAENRDIYSPQSAEFVANRIKRAAAVYGICEDVKKAMTKHGAVYDPMSDPGNYAWVQRDEEGNVVKLAFPIFDTEGVKLACEYLEMYRSKYSLEEATEIAQGICKCASAVDAEPTRYVKLAAGDAVPDPIKLKEEWDHRSTLTKDAGQKELMQAVGKAIMAAPPEDLVYGLSKAAGVIEEFDRVNGVDPHTHMKPEEIVYGMTMDEAVKMAEDSVKLNKLVFSCDKLAAVDPEVFAVLGDDVVESLKDDEGLNRDKLANVLPTLPLPDKVLLEEHLTDMYA